MQEGLIDRAAITFKRIPGGDMCEFSYEESCDDRELVRETARTFGPTLELMGLRASVSEDGRTLRIGGICQIGHAADMIVSEFLPLSNAARAPLGDIWKGLVASGTKRHLEDGPNSSGENGHDVTDVQLRNFFR